MKKITLLLILNLSFLIFNSQKVKAQWVTIPDTNFVNWLTTNYPSCMSGNMMDTTCSAIVSSSYIDCSNSNISNLSGIQYFDNLQYLDCHSNYITTLPNLSISVLSIDCFDNHLMTLPALSDSLKFLNASANQLTVLPTLPSSIKKIFCGYNQLTNLPSLPYSLQTIDCPSNQLTNLPALPSSLQRLNCSDNQITSLPALATLNSLENIDFSNNLLNNLPALPSSLQSLNIYGNQFLNLPSLPITLNHLNCSNNLLSNLNLLPDSLIELQCMHNHLTTLPILPTNLKTLQCSNNLLNSLPALPSGFESLGCEYNQIIFLPTLPNSLINLSCFNNQLTSIPQVPNSMGAFQIGNNNISCVFNLPQSCYGYASINNTLLTCVPNQTCYSLGLPLCTDNDPIINPNNCQSVVNITGNVYTDMNNNCVYNTNDLNTQNIPVKLYDTQNNFLALSYTMNGVYSFTALQPDTFKIKINDIALPIDMACGQANNQSVILNTINQTISNINFPLVCDSAFDIQVHSVTPQGWVFPGQVHKLNTNLANDAYWYNLNCTNTNYSGTVTINVVGPVTYVAPAIGALTPTVNGNTLTYNISNFNNITPASFGIKLLTDTTAQAGQQICIHVSIAATPADADTTNNEYTFCYNIFNSYDPNMKEVYPTNVLPGYNDWFTYTIHFQNTGTAPAFNIRLRDTLDTQLDINTFEYLGASHIATTSLNGRNLNIRFNNIMLPDSTSNYDGSMGYYQYRIKPLQNLPNGSNIKNTAYIYFDYNPAIVTNTTENNFDIFTNVQTTLPQASRLWLYPNPSNDIFTFNDTKNLKTVEVYNIFGQLILSQGNKKQVDLSDFSKGIYFAKINGEKVVKLLKE